MVKVTRPSALPFRRLIARFTSGTWQIPVEPGAAVVIASFFCLFTLLACLFPYSGDDWAWGSEIGLERLASHFNGYNGRYAGNLSILVLTRVGLLAPVVVGVVMTLTMVLLTEISGVRKMSAYLLSALLLLGMPLGLWRQSVAWLSGFANYAFAALGLVLLGVVVRTEFRGDAAKSKWRSPLLHAMLAVWFALYMEHVTIALIGFAGLACFVAWRRRRRVGPALVAWAGGVTVGGLIMFSNSAYRQAVTTDSQYQQIDTGLGAQGSLAKLDRFLDLISNLAVIQNRLLNMVILALVAVLLVVRRSSMGTAMPIAALGGGFLSITYLFGGAVASNASLVWRGLNGVAAGMFVAMLLLVAWALLDRTGDRVTILAAVGMILLLCLPVISVTPIGPRLFYPSYLCFVVMALVLFKNASIRAGTDPIVPLLAASCAIFFLGYSAVYFTIHMADRERLATAQHAVQEGSSEVVLSRLPFSNFVHVPDPKGAPWEERYKRFYNLPEDLSIVVR